MKARNYIGLGVLLVSVTLFIGCADINRDNLNKLEVGMTKGQVLEIMGKPYRREAEGSREWLLYETKAQRGYLWTESDYLTPLLIEDGKLVGWGKNFWVTKEQKYDVKIDQTIKQD